MIVEPLHPLDLQLMFMEAYDVMLNIFDHHHLGDTRPLALVAVHDAEDVRTETLLRVYMDRFRRYGVAEKWGLSFREFMAQTRYEAESMLEIENGILVEEYKERLKAEEQIEKNTQQQVQKQARLP